MSNNYISALTYAQMQNTIDDTNYWTTNASILFADTQSRQSSAISSTLNNLLSDTTIKRACCLRNDDGNGNYEVLVRIPIPTDFDVDDSSIEYDYKYIDKTIKVPHNFLR